MILKKLTGGFIAWAEDEFNIDSSHVFEIDELRYISNTPLGGAIYGSQSEGRYHISPVNRAYYIPLDKTTYLRYDGEQLTIIQGNTK